MATKDCTFFVDIDGRQVEMDFDGFRAYLMQDGVMATLAPDLTKKRGKKAGFTITAQKAEPTPARAEAAPVRAEAPKARAEAPTPSEMEVSSENLRKLMPKLSKARADAIIAVMKAMGIPFDRLKIAKGKLEGKLEGESLTQEAYHATKGVFAPEPGFPNGRFRLDKIGTGTGRAVEGYGIYFAQVPRIAGKYYEKFIKGGNPAVLYKLDIPDSIIPKLFNRADPLPPQVFKQLADVAKSAGRAVQLNPEMTLAQLMKTLGENAAGAQLLESAGVLGAIIPQVSFRGTSDNYLIWSQSALDKIALLEANKSPLQQMQQGKETLQRADIRYQEEASPLGSITFIDDLNALISVFEKANFSTVIHEAMHFYRRHMLNTAQGFTAEEIKRFEDWAGAKNGKWSVEAEEKAARAFEKYLRDGLAPLPELRDLFRKVARWMREVYATLTGSPVDIDIPADIRQIFDRMFTLEAERQKGGVGKETTPTAGARSLQQIDIKARDAEYMAAVKAGDTAKAQRMVEEAAKIAGYNETGSHGLAEGKLEGNAFDLERLGKNTGKANARLGFFFGSKETAQAYAQMKINPEKAEQVASMARDIITPLLDVVPKGASRELDFARENIETLFSPKSLDILEPELYKAEISFRVSRLLDEALEVADKANKTIKKQLLRDTLREANKKLDNTIGLVSFYAISDYAQVDAVLRMENPLVHDQQGVRYREQTYYDIIQQAKAQGHDSVIIKNTYDGGPLDDIKIVFEPSQIKSADPITYDDKGNVIPLSERFKPSTPDIRYQREGEGVPQAETATAAYRRAMREQQQEKAAKALQGLNQPRRGVRKPATFAPAQPRPALEITPMNRRAVIEAMEELRTFRRQLERRGVNVANASDVDLDRWEKLLNRVEQLGGVNPITPQMDAEYSQVVRELLARYKTASARDLAKQALEDDKFMALHDKAATLAFGIPRVVPGSTHATADNLMVEKRLAAKVLGLDASKAENVTGTQVLLAVLKDTAPTGVLAGHRKAIFEVIQRSFHADEFVRKATTLSNWRRDITDYVEDRLDRFTPERLQHLKRLTRYISEAIRTRSTAAATVKFKTGEPALVSVYRGGDLRGGEFHEQFLGSFTKAPSARMGYFFAGRSATAVNYSYNVQRYAVAMYNPLVYDYKGNVYREESLAKIIMNAWMDGHDGVIATDIYDPAPIDNVFIIPSGGENRIKAYGLAYDAKGKIIPLSERFNPTTKNVLYQGEDPLPNVEGTSTEAFRRKQAEQRQKNLVDAMNRLRQGKGQAPPKTEGQAAQAATPPPTAQAAPTTPPPSRTAPPVGKTGRQNAPKPRPKKTVAQQYDDMLKRVQKPGKPYQDATPEERADMYIKRQIRKLQDLLKMAQQKGINVDTMEVNGKTVSRKDHFTQAAEDYRKAFLNQDHVGMSAATDRMRDATDSIVSQLPELKAMPLWYNSRSPLSYANVVGSYEGMMGELGRQISEAFMRVHSDIARNLVSFTEGLKRLQEQMNRVYKPLMMDEGYYGMPKVIDDHITYLRNYMAYSSALQRVLAEQVEKNIKFLKNPMDWYVLRRDFARQRIGDQYGAFPLASAMLKSFIYTTKLKYNVKSAMTQYASLIMSVGPYMSPDQLAKIIAEAAKPSTGNRKVDGDLTLRQVAIGESGGRQAEGAPAEASSVWWHRGDVFQFTSEQVRIAGYLVGEEMVRREQEYLRQKGLPLLDEATQKRRIRDWVEKVEFDNSPWNMAPMFRGPVKGVLFQFKPFLQKNVERFIADMIRNPIGYQRGEARTPVGKLVNKLPDSVVRRTAAFGYQIGFGGISSALTLIPGLKNVAAPLILGGLTSALVAMGMDDDNAEELAIAINYGFPAAIGMDLSSSMGFLDEIPGKTLAEQIVNFGLGPTVSTLAEVGKRTGELVETIQKPAKLGREDEKQAEITRRAINIPKAITPYTRMFETALDWVQGKPSTIYLDKEMQLTPYEKVIRMLGGTPIRQTMFFDEKESYGWQKSLMGKPTGFERLKKKEGESDANYFQRKSRADTLERIYLPRLQNYSGFKALSKEDQAIVLDNLWRNIVEESETPKPPDRSKFTPATLVQTRRANIRGKAREERRKAREQMYYGGRATPQEE